MGRILDATEIQKILPHRFPMLLVDRVEITEERKKAVAVKNVTINEDFFNGHFPGKPIMPGVLIVEAMAQSSGVLIGSSPELKGKIVMFMSINNAKFRRQVVPGDQLRMEVEVVKMKPRLAVLAGKAYVGQELAAEAEMMVGISDSSGAEADKGESQG